MSSESKGRPRRIQRTATLPADLVDRARNAVFWVRMLPGEPASYSELTERGIRDQVERLERTYNNGEPFDEGQLRPGPAPTVMRRVAEMRRLQAEAGQQAEGPDGSDGEGSSGSGEADPQ